jgi:hypothetical protein
VDVPISDGNPVLVLVLERCVDLSRERLEDGDEYEDEYEDGADGPDRDSLR